MAKFKSKMGDIKASAGVYRWYYIKDQEETNIYVGCSKASFTLKRGTSQYDMNPFSSHGSGNSTLDTNFIVGHAVSILEQKYECIWEHIDDDPLKEGDYCQILMPKLQKGLELHDDLKLRRQKGYWRDKPAVIAEAKRDLELLLKKYLPGT